MQANSTILVEMGHHDTKRTSWLGAVLLVHVACGGMSQGAKTTPTKKSKPKDESMVVTVSFVLPVAAPRTTQPETLHSRVGVGPSEWFWATIT